MTFCGQKQNFVYNKWARIIISVFLSIILSKFCPPQSKNGVLTLKDVFVPQIAPNLGQLATSGCQKMKLFLI